MVVAMLVGIDVDFRLIEPVELAPTLAAVAERLRRVAGEAPG